jgi:hypothetical protein
MGNSKPAPVLRTQIHLISSVTDRQTWPLTIFERLAYTVQVNMPSLFRRPGTGSGTEGPEKEPFLHYSLTLAKNHCTCGAAIRFISRRRVWRGPSLGRLFLRASNWKAVHCCTMFCSMNTSTIWVVSARGSSSYG